MLLTKWPCMILEAMACFSSVTFMLSGMHGCIMNIICMVALCLLSASFSCFSFLLHCVLFFAWRLHKFIISNTAASKRLNINAYNCITEDIIRILLLHQIENIDLFCWQGLLYFEVTFSSFFLTIFHFDHNLLLWSFCKLCSFSVMLFEHPMTKAIFQIEQIPLIWKKIISRLFELV